MKSKAEKPASALLHGRLLELLGAGLGASTQLAICSKSPCSIAILTLFQPFYIKNGVSYYIATKND
jgi:hypothetical protein